MFYWSFNMPLPTPPAPGGHVATQQQGGFMAQTPQFAMMRPQQQVMQQYPVQQAAGQDQTQHWVARYINFSVQNLRLPNGTIEQCKVGAVNTGLAFQELNNHPENARIIPEIIKRLIKYSEFQGITQKQKELYLDAARTFKEAFVTTMPRKADQSIDVEKFKSLTAGKQMELAAQINQFPRKWLQQTATTGAWVLDLAGFDALNDDNKQLQLVQNLAQTGTEYELQVFRRFVLTQQAADRSELERKKTELAGYDGQICSLNQQLLHLEQQKHHEMQDCVKSISSAVTRTLKKT
jgi:hypothetical protein